MKNKLFTLATIFIVVATTIIVASCMKDKDNDTDNTIKDDSSKAVVQELELSDMDESMLAFGEALKNAVNEKDAVTLPLNEALGTLTDYQNFSLCNASFNPREMIVDTFKVKLAVTNGEVSLSDLYGIYQTTRAEILAMFNSLTGDLKSIFFIITNTADNLQGAELSNLTGVVDVNVVSYMANTVLVPDPVVVFDATDYWKDFEFQGKCDIYANQCVGRDCVTELNTKLHQWWSMPICPPGYRTYYTSTDTITHQSMDYHCSSSPNGAYAWPFRGSLDPEACVSPSEMNWYLQRIEGDMADIEETAGGRQIISFSFDEEFVQPTKLPNYYYHSVLTCILAVVNCTPLPND